MGYQLQQIQHDSTFISKTKRVTDIPAASIVTSTIAVMVMMVVIRNE